MPETRPALQDDPEPKTLGEIVRRWPKATFCIAGEEFCERFSFYGMRAVLTLYMLNILRFNAAHLVYFYHGFIVLCFSSPILGSTLADGYIGKYWTIFFISIMYASGQLVLAVSSLFDTFSPTHPALDILGLVLIGLGTGGIKPCVCAFGGDQFNPEHTKMLSLFFSVFYFSVNAGSLMSMFVTPELRAMDCRGQESCFPLAFALPAGLMLFATMLFMSGSVYYKKLPPKENVVFRVISVMSRALRNKVKSELKRDHWLDHYLDTHCCETDDSCLALIRSGTSTSNQCAQKKFVGYVKSLLRVLVMLLPVPMFFALYDQQALAMDGHISSSFMMLPDQMGILNAILILVSIPIFQLIIYPTVRRIGIQTTPLRRMAAGGFLASLAFVLCAAVQLRVNSLVDDVVGKRMEVYRVKVGQKAEHSFQMTFNPACLAPAFNATVRLYGGTNYYAVISENGFFYEEALNVKPSRGKGESSLNINMLIPCSRVPRPVDWGNCGSRNPSHAYAGDLAFCKIDSTGVSSCKPNKEWQFVRWSASRSHSRETESERVTPFLSTVYGYTDLRSGRYHVYYVHYNGTGNIRAADPGFKAVLMDGITVEIKGMGGVYSLTLAQPRRQADDNDTVPHETMHTIVFRNHINIAWQVPQYLALTCAEVLISMTGIEFAYSQAAPSLKSVVQAIWLFTVAVGDIIIIFIELLHLFENLAYEMLVYAGVMFIVIIIFSLLAIYYYEYVHYGHEESAGGAASSKGDDRQNGCSYDVVEQEASV